MSAQPNTSVFSFRFVALLAACFVLLSVAQGAYAATLRITEVMYNPQGGDSDKEYIEVQNISSSSIDLSALRLVVGGTSKRAMSVYQGKSLLPPKKFALIVPDPASFLAHHADYTESLYDTSSYSLRNSGENTIEIVAMDGRSVAETIASVQYDTAVGGGGNGESLHFIGGDTTPIAATPSPGAAHRGSASTRTQATGTSSGSQSTQGVSEVFTSISGNTEEDLHLFSEPKIIFAGREAELMFRYPERTESIHGRWNFGDGATMTDRTVRHTYQYPGLYTLHFTQLSRVPRDSDGVHVREVAVLELLANVERIDSQSVRIENNHPFPLDISQWKVVSDRASFTFPQSSVIAATTSVRVPFASSSQDTITVTDAEGLVVPIVKVALPVPAAPPASAPTPPPSPAPAPTTEHETVSSEASAPVETEHTAAPAHETNKKQIAVQNNGVVVQAERNIDIQKIIMYFALWLVILLLGTLPLFFIQELGNKKSK